MKTRNKRGPRTVPWGTPDVTLVVLLFCPRAKLAEFVLEGSLESKTAIGL